MTTEEMPSKADIASPQLVDDYSTDEEFRESMQEMVYAQVQSDSNLTIVEGEVLPSDEDLLHELPENCSEIDLVQLKIVSLVPLGLNRFLELERICLRQNLLTSLGGTDNIKSPVLKELDLYDNRIPSLSRLENMRGEIPYADSLTDLDLSFNLIKHIRGVNQFKGLKNLYFVQNRISKIEALDELTELINLELGGNKIRTLENLDKLSSLEQLWVGKNKISRMENLSNLKNLKILSIQSNRLKKIEGLDELEALEELYTSFNGITKIEGLEKNKNLRTLDISNNAITHLENLSHLSHLEELWASSNKMSSFEEIERELKTISSLETVYFEGNPLQKQAGPTYRNKIRLSLGSGLKQIDATFVRPSEVNLI